MGNFLAGGNKVVLSSVHFSLVRLDELKACCKKVWRVWSSGHHCFQAHPAYPTNTSLRTQGRHISPSALLMGWLGLTQNFPFQDMCLAKSSDSLKLQSTIKGRHSSSILFLLTVCIFVCISFELFYQKVCLFWKKGTSHS